MEKMEVDLTFEELKILQEVGVGSISKEQTLVEVSLGQYHKKRGRGWGSQALLGVFLPCSHIHLQIC